MKRYAVLAGAMAIGSTMAVAACNLVVDAGGYKADLGADASTGDDAGGEGGPVSCGNGLASGADFDQLVESCVLTVSCDPYFFDVTIASCLTYDYLHVHQAYACLTGIHSCNDYYQCAHSRLAALADCPNSTANAVCNDDLAVNCTGQGEGTVDNCASLGGTCGTVDGVAACIVVPSCTDTDGGTECSGTTATYECIGGRGYGSNCGSGLTCGNGASGPGCYFNAPTCGTPNVAECNGTSAEYCTEGRQEFTFNCSLSGSSCYVADGGTDYYCVSPGCTPAAVDSCKESCASDGKTINTCIGGAPYPIDCTKYGFTGCTQSTDTSTTPSTVYTHCE
jgi:hypothetical protein